MSYRSSHSGYNKQSEEGGEYVYLPKDSEVTVTYDYKAFESDGSDTNWRTCEYKSGDECYDKSGKQTFTMNTKNTISTGKTNWQKKDLKVTGNGAHRPYFEWKLMGPYDN